MKHTCGWSARVPGVMQSGTGGATFSRPHLDTLALAYHLTGDTAQAIETQKRAIALLPDSVDGSLRTELSHRLSGYETVGTRTHDGLKTEQSLKEPAAGW